MKYDSIVNDIKGSLSAHGITDADIRVQPDGLGGWKIAVVTDKFGALSNIERKALVSLDPSINLSWEDYLTHEEKVWAGALPADLSPDLAPLWAESLGRATTDASQAIFASDLDEDLPKPAITTFYSLRGGVGRSTALINAAKILASRGRSVIVVDMDLEAPGLSALLGVENEVRAGRGVVDALIDLDIGLNDIDLNEYLIRVGPDNLFCLPAGRPDAEYARKLTFIDPRAWYHEDKNPLRELFYRISKHLSFVPDHILVDSRTGISPISGPLLFDLPDLAIIVFFPHPQAQEGTRLLTGALTAAKSQRNVAGRYLTPEPRFIASPVPGGDSFDKYSRRAKEWVSDWIQPINSARIESHGLLDSDITHVIPYRDALATNDKISNLSKEWSDYTVVADWIDKLGISDSTTVAVETVSQKKEAVLSQLNFPTGTAEVQENLLETFVQTDVIRKALSAEIPLVRGRKGTGKTALFRLLTETGERPAVKIVAPQSLQLGMPWTWSSDAYRAVDELLQKHSLDWKFFWSFYISVHIHSSQNQEESQNILPANLASTKPRSELDIINLFENVSVLPRRELIVAEWLRQLDKRCHGRTMLAFDGLDTGFGNTSTDKARRRNATEGLFSFLIDRGSQLENLRLKILLREDIWRQLRFDNKSHLFGRDVNLSWQNGEDFYKVVISHARKSSSFAALMSQDKSLSALNLTEPESWASEVVTRAWILLIGERMKGSGTTYTQNWVWNRLADANADRNPRYLLMLMNLVTTWERQENARSKYERSVIRPRALEQQLPFVSQWALDALKEEFEEITSIFDVLSNERTPLSADLLDNVDQDMLALSREIGLLGVYQERDGSPEKYSVPEIYRLALGMKRRGQA